MKNLLIYLLVVLLGTCVNELPAQIYQPIDKSSEIKIVVKNVGMEVEAILTGLEGDITFITTDLKKSNFSVSLDAASISTGIDIRDSNLQNLDYLDTKKYPKIYIASKQITQGSKPESFLLKATLTLKGISKDVSIPFTVVPAEGGMVFSGNFKINRLDFKIGVGSVVLSNSMSVSLVVFAKKV